MSVFFLVLGSAVAGALLSSLISILPALHVFNIMGGLFLGLIALRDAGLTVPPEAYIPMMTGLVVG